VTSRVTSKVPEKVRNCHLPNCSVEEGPHKVGSGRVGGGGQWVVRCGCYGLVWAHAMQYDLLSGLRLPGCSMQLPAAAAPVHSIFKLVMRMLQFQLQAWQRTWSCHGGHKAIRGQLLHSHHTNDSSAAQVSSPA
jgi:hypothetical protein